MSGDIYAEMIICDRCGNAEQRHKSWRSMKTLGYYCSKECADATTDDLGDTPEHLRELLREARKRVPGTVITEQELDEEDLPVLWAPNRRWWGYYVGQDRELAHWHDSDSGACDRQFLRTAIEQGRAYPTTDARRIGREEFGMVFEDEVGLARAKLDAAALRTAKDLGMKPEALDRLTALMGVDPGRDEGSVVITACGKDYKVKPYTSQEELDRDFGVGRFKFTSFVPKSLAPIASVEVRDLRPTCSQCSTHMDPRHDGDDTCSAECHQAKLGKRREQERAMKYEASEHVYRKVRADSYFHGLMQGKDDDARRAQLRADMDRPLPRVSIEHAEPLNPAALPGVCGVRGKRGGPVKAPSTWPEDAGWDDV